METALMGMPPPPTSIQCLLHAHLTKMCAGMGDGGAGLPSPFLLYSTAASRAAKGVGNHAATLLHGRRRQ